MTAPHPTALAPGCPADPERSRSMGATCLPPSWENGGGTRGLTATYARLVLLDSGLRNGCLLKQKRQRGVSRTSQEGPGAPCSMAQVRLGLTRGGAAGTLGPEAMPQRKDLSSRQHEKTVLSAKRTVATGRMPGGGGRPEALLREVPALIWCFR